MTLEEFADVTRRVIAHEGFVGFQPTACFPARDHLALLSHMPASADVETASVEWALEESRHGEEFLVAFKIDDGHFKIVRRAGMTLEDRTFAV